MSGEGQTTAEPARNQETEVPQAAENNTETQPAGAIFVGRKAQEIDTQLEEIKARGNKEELERFFGVNNGVNDLFSLNHLEIVGEEGFKDGVTKVNIQGQDRAIQDVKIDENNNTVYRCKVDGIDDYIEAPREIVKNVLLVEKKDSVLALFSGDERRAVEDYIGGLDNGSIPLSTRWEEEAKQDQATPEKSPEDMEIANKIAQYRKLFEKKFETARTQNAPLSDEDSQTLIMLRLAEAANGDEGVILKHLALKNLRDDHGEQRLDGAVNDLQEKASAAIDKVSELMDKAKAEEFRKAIEEGKLGDLIKEGKLLKIEGIRELLFGKDMTEEKLKEILRIDKKKNWKNPLLLALIILLIGPMELGKEVVPMPGSRN